MRLYALSDVHVGHRENRQTLARIPPHREDWLILAGDVGETERHLEWTLELLAPRFAQLLWVPGNHDLWVHPEDPGAARGERKYQRLVDLCRQYGVFTPEDPFVTWSGAGGEYILVPMFLLYDYSFRPDHVPPERAVAWARESGVLCADERFLDPTPHASREAWCAARIRATVPRLERAAREAPLVLINHWPLRQDLVHLKRIPRFCVWCGTRRTEDWHVRYNARVVVSGHTHVRATEWRDGVRFEEVSLGYPEHWRDERGAHGYLREILPGPTRAPAGRPDPLWHR